LSANDLVDLRMALASYGPSSLLWVQEARPGHPPGSVVVVDNRLMIGYVSRLAPRHNVPDLDLASWLRMLRKACVLHPLRAADPDFQGRLATRPDSAQLPSRVDIVFGKGGNATESIGYGWSAPEDGFTWSIDDRSLVIMESPGDADEYWLEMDVIPYVAPPAVSAQSLIVAVNGEPVHTFNALMRGKVSCIVPGHLLKAAPRVEIVLDHPKAASPSVVAGEKDDRRIAIAFCSLSLACN